MVIYPVDVSLLLVGLWPVPLSRIGLTVGDIGLLPYWYWLMMTSSNENIFRVTGHLCGEFTGHRWIPHTKASDAENVFFDLRPNKLLSEQSWRWWIETPSRPFWRYRYANISYETKRYVFSELKAWISNYILWFLFIIGYHFIHLYDISSVTCIVRAVNWPIKQSGCRKPTV